MFTRLLCAVLILATVPSLRPPLRAQSKLEKAAWVTGGAIALGIYDYFGYNLTYRNSAAYTGYRVTFCLVQAAITYLLYEKFGLPSAIGFNLIWWTFGVDMVFYGVSELNPNTGGSWAARGAWYSDSHPGIKHAYFTPVGLVRGARRGNPIAGDTIIAQAFVGAAIAISMSIAL